MSNYNTLKDTINANIKQNGNQEITGSILNSVLNQMVNILGTGYQFAGVATTATNPGTPDAKVFYIANGKGTYTNFGGLEVTEDDVVVLYWDSSWHKVSTGIASDEKLTELGQKVDSGIFNPQSALSPNYDENDKYYTISGGVIRYYAVPGCNTKIYNVSSLVGKTLHLDSVRIESESYSLVAVFGGSGNIPVGDTLTSSNINISTDIVVPEGALYLYVNYKSGEECVLSEIGTFDIREHFSDVEEEIKESIKFILYGNATALEDVFNGDVSDLYGTFTLNSAITLADNQRLIGHNCIIVCGEYAKIYAGNSSIIEGIKFMGGWNPVRIHGDGVTFTQFGYEPIKFIHNANQTPRYHELGKYATLTGGAVSLISLAGCNCKLYEAEQLVGETINIKTIVPDTSLVAYYVCDSSNAVLLSAVGNVDEDIVVPNGAKWIYLNYSTRKNGFLTIISGTEEYLSLDDLRNNVPGLCGPGKASYDALINVDIDKCYNTTIKNCIFEGFDRVAINMAARRHTENSNGQIFGNYFYNCCVAVFLSGEFVRLYGNVYTGCVIGLYSYVSNLNQYGEIFKCCDCAIFLAANHTGHSELSATQIAHSGLASLFAREILPTLGYQVCNCHIVDGAITGYNINNLLIVSGRLDVYFKYTDGGSRNSILCSNIGKSYLYGNPLYSVPSDSQIALNRGLYNCTDAEANNQA